MSDEKTKSFEEIFNDWYKKFLKEESGMNEEIKNAKKFREEKLAQARKEAWETIKSYEMEQKDKLESDKEKLNVTKNNFDQLDNDYKKEVERMKQMQKQNKEKVIDYWITRVLDVSLELPASIIQETSEGKKGQKKKL